jgi:long-chain acyl-CoA synthetase
MIRWLYERMRCFSDHPAIVCNAAHTSYQALVERVETWWRVFEANGLPQGAVVAIAGDYSADSCALFLALSSSGRVVAPLPGDEDRGRYLAPAAVEAVVEFDASGGWTWSALAPPQPSPLLQRLRGRGSGGVVVFSSGTTGESKAGLFDFATLIKRYQEPRRGSRTLAFLRLDHLGGIHTMLHTLAHGGTLIVAKDRNPEAVCRAIERDRVELLPTTPTFLRLLVISNLHDRYDLSSLRLITYGTEPMPAATLRGLRSVFPDVRFKQTYGLSELGVLPTRSPTSDSLWLEIGCDTRVVDGELWIRSDTAMLGYLNLPSPFDAEGWYNTGDAVAVDGRFLRILGRNGDLINVGGEKIYPAEIEDALLDLDNVRDATVWGQANPVTGQIVAARVTLAEPEDPVAFERRLYDHCRGRLAPHKVPLVVDILAGDQYGERFKKIRPR